jgi:hypothetical protein
MPPAPNHAPTPVQEGVHPALPGVGDCAEIKEEFGVKTNTHAKNTRGAEKLTSRDKGLQSHHILQDAQTAQIIPRGSAIAVILQDSHGGSEHGTITARQNARMNNKGGAGGPAATFGALKTEARDDLVAGLEGKRKSTTTGKPMTKQQAEALADCLVKEAEDAAKAEAARNDEEVNDSTPVPPPDGCLTPGTVVWLADASLRMVEDLVPGDEVSTPDGPRAIVRIDTCRHDLVELDLDTETLIIASYHRLLSHHGEWRRADAFVPGDVLQTLQGAAPVRACRPKSSGLTFRLSFVRPTTCAIGTSGTWARMLESRVPVRHSESIDSPAGGTECRT